MKRRKGKKKTLRIPKLCVRGDDGRLYVTDPDTHRQVPMASQREYEAWRAAFVERRQAEGVEAAPEGPRLRPRCTVAELCRAYLAHARGWYRKRGRQTSHVQSCVEPSLRGALEVFGVRRDASSVRAADMERLLEHWVGKGLARTTVNARARKVRQVWRWGVRKEAVDAASLERLRSVEGLKKHRTAAPEGRRVQAADPDHLERAAGCMRPPYLWVLRVQMATGGRPGEVCALRPRWIDRSGPVWVVEIPDDFDKQAHTRGPGDPPRRLYVGPRGQAVLGPLLRHAPPDRPLFKGRDRRGTHLTVNAYGRHLRAACARAGVPRVAPNQIRHAAGTEARRRFGLDAAQAFLGHAKADITEVYAQAPDELARKVALAIG